MIAGIDPGASGAIAFLDEDGLATVHDLPVIPKTTGKGKMLDGTAFASLLLDHKPQSVLVEAQHSMPGQGVAGVFNLGLLYGALLGILQALQIPIYTVTPHAWKKAAGLIGKEKDASRTLAIMQHPEAANSLTRKKDHNRAEAILIAHYHRKRQ